MQLKTWYQPYPQLGPPRFLPCYPELSLSNLFKALDITHHVLGLDLHVNKNKEKIKDETQEDCLLLPTISPRDLLDYTQIFLV